MVTSDCRSPDTSPVAQAICCRVWCRRYSGRFDSHRQRNTPSPQQRKTILTFCSLRGGLRSTRPQRSLPVLRWDQTVFHKWRVPASAYESPQLGGTCSIPLANGLEIMTYGKAWTRTTKSFSQCGTVTFKILRRRWPSWVVSSSSSFKFKLKFKFTFKFKFKVTLIRNLNLILITAESNTPETTRKMQLE